MAKQGELEENPFGNFSIESSTEIGNTELLKGFLDDEPIDTTKLEPIKKDEKIVKKEEDTSLINTEKVENEGQDILKDFLEDEKEEETTSDITTKTPESKDDESQFTALSRDLRKLGVFSPLEEGEDDIKTDQEFLELFTAEKKKGAVEMIDNFIGQFGEDYQNAFRAIYEKGVNPKDYFGTYNTITSFAELDLTKEENQIKVVRQALSDEGLEPEDVDSEVERIKNYGDLEAVAGKRHKVLVRKEAVKLQQMEQKAETDLQQKVAIKQQFIQNVNTVLEEKIKSKEFDGIPLNLKLAKELQDFLLTDRYRTPSGETLTEFDHAILELKRPENHLKKIKLGLLLKTLEKDPTLSTIQKSGITKKSDKLFEEVARQSKSTPTTELNKESSWWIK